MCFKYEKKKKKKRHLKAKKSFWTLKLKRPTCSWWQHFFEIISEPTRQRVKRHDGSVPSEPLLRRRLSAFIPLFVTLKSRCLTYKLIYKLHFSMNPFHCGCGPSTLSSGPRIHLQMKPREKCSPAPQRDRMPSHCSRSMGAAGMVGTAWPCSSRSTQSRSCLIQGLSPSMFLRSQTSDNTKLP